ncbi:hypothetical protein HDU96_006866 [Phlyctochytrium bullatum]|nr:hypothetical protein HDU96_006866 [Phlyctochytrium bullatum]
MIPRDAQGKGDSGLELDVAGKGVLPSPMLSDLGGSDDGWAADGGGDEHPTFMYYINDGMYGSFNCITFDHQVVVPQVLVRGSRFHHGAGNRPDGEVEHACSIWGPTCDSFDCITRECVLPELRVGDWLYFENMGAYTMSAASQFNGFRKSSYSLPPTVPTHCNYTPSSHLQSPTPAVMQLLAVLALAAAAILPANAQNSTAEPRFCTNPNDLPDTCNWDRGPNTVDPMNPTGQLRTRELVYIQDLNNYCMNLPDIEQFPGITPTFLMGEGFVRSHCVGPYVPAGAKVMPPGGIGSAVLSMNIHRSGARYYQMHGYLNCPAIGIDCDAFDNSGQIDNVIYRYFGRQPYSGVDTARNPGYTSYVMQAGNHIYCYRVCEGGLNLDDPCNAKNDTLGCALTMGVTEWPAWGTFRFVDNTGATPRLITTFTSSIPTTRVTSTSTSTSTSATVLATTTESVSTASAATTTTTLTASSSSTAPPTTTAAASTTGSVTAATQRSGAMGQTAGSLVAGAMAVLAALLA